MIDPEGTLYAGGSFTSAGGATATNSITQAPVAWLTGFSPATRSVGSKIEVFGEGLYGASDVRFAGAPGGISTSFYVETDTSMTVTVPPGAQNGVIQVFTSCGRGAYSPSQFISTGCLTTGLVGWWPAELDAKDISGNHHDGTLENGTSFTYPGESGAAFSLDGVYNDVLVSNSSGAFNSTSAMSIEGWIKTTKTSEYIATRYEVSFYLAVGITSPHTLAFWLNGVTSSWVNGVTPVDDGAWHHVAATYDGASIKLYVDGNLDASVAGSGTIPTGVDGVTIGSRYPYPVVSPTRFAGSIDELAIYNRALTRQEVGSLAYGNGTGPCGVTSVDEGGGAHAARALELALPWPNPASGVTNFEFRLASAKAVRAEIVDVAGRRVSLPLKETVLTSGVHHFQWDGRNTSGERVPAGVYMLRVRAGDAAAVQRIVLVR
jgi:hypothetical protein